jgi:hypothetical protein
MLWRMPCGDDDLVIPAALAELVSDLANASPAVYYP